MSDPVTASLLTAAAMVTVGMLAFCGNVLRNNRKNGNPGRACPIAPPLDSLKRDVADVDEHLEGLARLMGDQVATAQSVALVLGEIKTILKERLPKQGVQ